MIVWFRENLLSCETYEINFIFSLTFNILCTADDKTQQTNTSSYFGRNVCNADGCGSSNFDRLDIGLGEQIVMFLTVFIYL